MSFSPAPKSRCPPCQIASGAADVFAALDGFAEKNFFARAIHVLLHDHRARARWNRGTGKDADGLPRLSAQATVGTGGLFAVNVHPRARPEGCGVGGEGEGVSIH